MKKIVVAASKRCASTVFVRAITALGLLSMCPPVVASTDVAAKPSSVDAIFAPYIVPGSPGVAVGVYRGGKVVFSRGYGLADLESNIPVTPRTQFHVASVSKQFTAFAIALLAREGKLDLDADVRRYLPYLPDFGHVITPRQLVQHTSGLRDQWALFQIGGRDMRDLLRQEQVISLVKRQRTLNFAPGSDFLYSNTGYTLLAEIVSAVSGKTLRQFTTERMFEPLGMHRTFFFDDVREVVPGRANSYMREGDGPWMRALLNYQTVGATSLFTTIEDLARWAGNFHQTTVGDAQLIDLIGRGGALNDGTPIHYGFGLTDSPQAGRVAVSHSGSDAGFLTHFVYYPDHDVAIALLANRSLGGTPVTQLVDAVANLYLPRAKAHDDVTNTSAPVPAAATLAALVGTYVHPFAPAVVLESDNRQLFSSSGALGDSKPLSFEADGSFRATSWLKFRPIVDSRGAVVALQTIPRTGGAGKRYERVQRLRSSPQSLAHYSGNYRSDELDVTYSFSVEGDALVIRSLLRVEPIRLQQITADRFDVLENGRTRAPFQSVTFERNARQEIVAVRVHDSRAYNIEFRKVAAPRS